MFYLMLAIYAPLLFKGIASLTRLDKLIPRLSKWNGALDYSIAFWRDTLISYLIGIWGVYFLIRHGYQGKWLLMAALALYSQVNWIHRRRFRLAFCHWVLRFDGLEPDFFFETYYRGLGSFSNQLPKTAKTVRYSYIDYRRGDPPKKTIWPLLLGSLDTATLAKLAILAMKKLPGEDGINAFDTFARLWGARFVSRGHVKLKTIGVETLPPLKGKVLLVFNHKSYLDFALNFFALGDVHNNGRHLRPRFIAAKDHFIDNPLVYSWLGVGKCIEKAGMIFINRKKGKGWLAMREAAEKLTETDVEVAVYPQGTRAWGLIDEKGNRIDAGYYTTLTKKSIDDPRGHLKIGTAQLILDTALRLREKGEPPLQVLFVGIDGTATVGSKGSFLIQTETEMTFLIGNCWTFHLPSEIPLENPEGNPTTEAHANYLDELEAIQELIDRELEKTIDRHRTLMERCLGDPPLQLTQEDHRELTQFLKRADETENILPFAILDRLYALPHARWEVYFRALLELALKDAKKSDWEALRKMVSEELLGTGK